MQDIKDQIEIQKLKRQLDNEIKKNKDKDSTLESYDVEQDTPWTKEEICSEVKSLTMDYTAKQGEVKTYFDEEKDFAIECFEENGYDAYADRQGGKWVITFNKREVKEHVAVDRYDQLDDKNCRGVVEISSTSKGSDSEIKECVKSLKEDKESYRLRMIDEIKTDIDRDKLSLDIARREAERDPNHKEYFDKMIRDYERHIKSNEDKLAELESNEEEKTLADYLNRRTFDSALRDRDAENRKSLEDADKVKPSILKPGDKGYDKLEYAAERATLMSPNGFNYKLGDTYLDFGANWQWTTLIAYKRDGDNYQALNPVEWEEIANAKTDAQIDKVIEDMFKDRYCPDRDRNKVESLRDAMYKLDTLDD